MESIRVADAGRHFMCPVAVHVAMGVGETVNTRALFLWVPAHTPWCRRHCQPSLDTIDRQDQEFCYFKFITYFNICYSWSSLIVLFSDFPSYFCLFSSIVPRTCSCSKLPEWCYFWNCSCFIDYFRCLFSLEMRQLKDLGLTDIRRKIKMRDHGWSCLYLIVKERGPCLETFGLL